MISCILVSSPTRTSQGSLFVPTSMSYTLPFHLEYHLPLLNLCRAYNFPRFISRATSYTELSPSSSDHVVYHLSNYIEAVSAVAKNMVLGLDCHRLKAQLWHLPAEWTWATYTISDTSFVAPTGPRMELSSVEQLKDSWMNIYMNYF